MKKTILIIGFLITGALCFSQEKTNLPKEIQKLFSQMVYVKGGEFNLYEMNIDDYREDGLPVSVSNLYAQKYEVSRALWQYVMEESLDCWEPDKNGQIDMTKPAGGISWSSAVDFCNKLNALADLDPCYDLSDIENVKFNQQANGFRLPTEAEWEFLGRGGALSHHSPYIGDSSSLEDVAWSGCGYRTSYGLHNSGLLKSNELGLYDLAGNLWEWCWDRYTEKSEEFYTLYKGKGVIKNYTGETAGKDRCLRGGAYDTDNSRAMFVACHIYHENPEKSFAVAGLRLVRTAE